VIRNGVEIVTETPDTLPDILIDNNSINQHFMGVTKESAVTSNFLLGFVYEHQIYQYAKTGEDLFSIGAPTCIANSCGAMCPDVCLSTCLWNQWFDDEGSCTTCDDLCTSGCTNGDNCKLCVDRECKTCANCFDECEACVDFTKADLLDCTCRDGFEYKTDLDICTFENCMDGCELC
jgi:hypothetical protein